MADTLRQKAIRQQAARELGEWLEKNVKEEVLVNYRFFRSHGFKASVALSLSKEIVGKVLNKMAKNNFYGRSPW